MRQSWKLLRVTPPGVRIPLSPQNNRKTSAKCAGFFMPKTEISSLNWGLGIKKFWAPKADKFFVKLTLIILKYHPFTGSRAPASNPFFHLLKESRVMYFNPSQIELNGQSAYRSIAYVGNCKSRSGDGSMKNHYSQRNSKILSFLPQSRNRRRDCGYL